MKVFTLVRRVIPLLMFVLGTSHAQTLAEVLCSVQERNLAAVQREQLDAHLRGWPALDQQLIEWTGLPETTAFPVNGTVDALTVGGRIALLNQAMAEFTWLAPYYLNLRPDDLMAGRKLGALRPYMQEDFTPLPRADAENFPAVLASFARQVRHLKILPWVASLRQREREFRKYKREILEDGIPVLQPDSDEIDWQQVQLDAGELDDNAPYWTTVNAGDPYSLGIESVSAGGTYRITTYHDGPPEGEGEYQLKSADCGQWTTFFSDARLLVAAPGADETVNGKVAMVARTELGFLKGDSFDALPDSWNPTDASFHVIAVSGVGGGEIELSPTGPGIKVKLAWSTLTTNGDVQSSLGRIDSSRAVGTLGYSSSLRRILYPLFIPSFSRGLDVTGQDIPGALARAGKVDRPPAGDAEPMLQPRPGLIAGIPLGVGLDGDSSLGWLGISPRAYDILTQGFDIWGPQPVDLFAYGVISPGFNSHAGYTEAELGIRFDFAANLRFVGAAEDFHVIYATGRGADQRGTALPTAQPTNTQFSQSGWEEQSVLTAWDLPRIRQVVGRDLIADVSMQGHYKFTVTIYRRPAAATPVDRTPGQRVSLEGLEPLRTLVFGNPNNENDDLFPASAEAVTIADGESATYSVIRSSLAKDSGNIVFTGPSVERTVSLIVGSEGQFGATVATSLDGVAHGSTTITGDEQWRWWKYRQPTRLVHSAAGETRTHDITLDGSPGCRGGLLARTLVSTGGNEQDVSFAWDANGVLSTAERGQWMVTTSPEGTSALKTVLQLNDSVWQTVFSNFDALGRARTVTANGITASHTFTALNVETHYEGTDIGEETESTITSDALGRLTASNTTWNGVTDNLGLTHGADTVDVTRTVGPYGTHTSKIRQADGSLEEADGATLPFGGVSGDGVTVSNGLLVTRTEILNDQGQGTGAFEETHADAWGRVRKIVTPSKSDSSSTTSSIHYSDPDSSLRRVITVEPSGRVSITESEPYGENGSVTRSGIDLNFTSVATASVGATDRYTESVTSVDGAKLVTILKVTDEPGPGVSGGLREVMRSEWTPSTGITITKINGNEEEITTTPNRTSRTVTTTSDKGWSRTTGVNALGLATSNTLSGTGIPTTDLIPTWRADGSLAGVSMTIGGEIHTAGFNPDGTLSSLTAPGRGNILGGHTINNGVETLTVDGVTVESKLDGTESGISGGNVVGRNEKLTTPNGGGFKHTTTPEVGEDTETHLNAAFAPTSKTYADDSDESYGYTNELLTAVSLARGGNLIFGYSEDSAKDLSTATWPAVASGPFTIPGPAHGFTYNRAGQIKTLSDSSGARSLSYQNGRLTSTAYTAGLLRGNEVIRNHDATGRNTGILLKRDGAAIHTTAKTPNGASDQITGLASGGITATPQRDAAGRITGYVWSDGTSNSVTQTWTRGAGGRIEFAGSDVPGAPTFDYLLNPGEPDESFGSRNRRLKCATAGGTWTYTYGLNGQLTHAIHEDAADQVILGDFEYEFDEIGRRQDKGAANITHPLNQSTAWTHSQGKTLRIRAVPGSNVRIEIGDDPQTYEDLTNFSGEVARSVPNPGQDGGWVGWFTRAVLEDAGEGAGSPPAYPLASPDAKAEKRGAVWVPPVNETLTFDLAGNRQSSAQWDYGWDAKNQLVRSRTKNCIATPGTPAALQGYDITYTYDAEGRRVRKHVTEYRNGAVVSQNNITFVWDGWDLLYERQQLPSGLTTLERKYLWGPDIADGTAGGAGGLLLIQETKGNATQKIIPLYDGTGHVVALTNLNKELLASYAYGPFGEKISATGPMANSNPWRWGTKYFDEETGLIYYGLRYYDPVTCQWLSRELLGESESANLYQFAGNDPVNFVDVNGLAKHRIAPDAVPVLVSEGDGVWAFYVKAELEGTEYRMTSPGGYGSYPSGYYASVWKDAGALKVGGQVGDKTAAQFMAGEISNQEVADLMRLANLQTEQMNAESVVDAWRTAGQFIPGVGSGLAFAEGDGIRGSAYFVRDVVLTVTGTKLLQGGKTLVGMTLRGAALGAIQGGTSAAFDVGAGRAQAAWNGETYAGTVNGDAWEMFRATRNGAAFGLVLGPVAKMASLRRAIANGEIIPWNGKLATEKLLGTSTTPGGKQINFHAADRMMNPPAGRVPMSVSEVEDFIDTATLVKKVTIDDRGTSITLMNSKYPKAQIAIDPGGKGSPIRIITVVNPRK